MIIMFPHRILVEKTFPHSSQKYSGSSFRQFFFLCLVVRQVVCNVLHTCHNKTSLDLVNFLALDPLFEDLFAVVFDFGTCTRTRFSIPGTAFGRYLTVSVFFCNFSNHHIFIFPLFSGSCFTRHFGLNLIPSADKNLSIVPTPPVAISFLNLDEVDIVWLNGCCGCNFCSSILRIRVSCFRMCCSWFCRRISCCLIISCCCLANFCSRSSSISLTSSPSPTVIVFCFFFLLVL